MSDLQADLRYLTPREVPVRVTPQRSLKYVPIPGVIHVLSRLQCLNRG